MHYIAVHYIAVYFVECAVVDTPLVFIYISMEPLAVSTTAHFIF